MASNQTHRQQVFQAASIVMGAILLSRVLGVGRDVVINSYFDSLSVEANAYAVASRFPQLIFTVIAGGALGSAFIPAFSGFFVREDEEGGWRLFSAIANLVFVATMVASILVAWRAESLITFFYPTLVADIAGFLPMTTALLRVMLLSTIIFGVSGVVMSALNARQHFLMPALAGSVYNLGIMVGTIVFAGNVMGIGYGVVLGALGHLLVQLPALRQKGVRYVPILTLRDPAVRRVLWLMAPRVLGLSFSEITHLVTQFLAQSLVFGSIRSLDLAWKVMSMPLGFLGQALGIAAFPTFATLAAEKNVGDMQRLLADTLRLIIFLALPATVLLVVLREPTVSLLFEYRNASETSTTYVAWALLFYAIGLVALAMIEVTARAFFALEDTVTPVVVGALQLSLMAVLGWWLSRSVFPSLGWLAFGGLALGHSLSNVLEMVVLLWLLRRKLGGIAGNHLVDGLWRMLLGAAGMFLVAQGVVWSLGNAGNLWLLLLGGTVGGFTYLSLAWLLQLAEITLLMKPVLRRLR